MGIYPLEDAKGLGRVPGAGCDKLTNSGQRLVTMV
jgi:hypothetical protein